MAADPKKDGIKDEGKSILPPLREQRFLTLTKVLYWTGGLYLIFIASFCVAYFIWRIVPPVEILILMTLPGYVITTIIGAIVGSAIDR